MVRAHAGRRNSRRAAALQPRRPPLPPPAAASLSHCPVWDARLGGGRRVSAGHLPRSGAGLPGGGAGRGQPALEAQLCAPSPPPPAYAAWRRAPAWRRRWRPIWYYTDSRCAFLVFCSITDSPSSKAGEGEPGPQGSLARQRALLQLNLRHGSSRPSLSGQGRQFPAEPARAGGHGDSDRTARIVHEITYLSQ